MRLFRFFKDPRYFNRWTKDQPDAANLLELFLKRDSGADVKTDISTFVAQTPLEEIENAAAWYATNHPKEPGRVFTVVMDGADLDGAGIQRTFSAKGGPGVKLVDARHCELAGTREQFLDLVKRTLKRLFEGENAVRVYPYSQVQLQLETFACNADEAFSKGAKKRVIVALGDVDLQSLQSGYDPRTGKIPLTDGSVSHTIVVNRPQQSSEDAGVSPQTGTQSTKPGQPGCLRRLVARIRGRSKRD